VEIWIPEGPIFPQPLDGRGTPISSLYYFANLFEEVQQEISTQYWNYVAHKVNTFEQTELWANPGQTLEK